jgi:acetoin utilization protein AcuB
MERETIRKYMTPTPVTIGVDQTLAAAHRLMRDHGVRHLPVLDGGKLVGILSLRDLHFLETLPSVKATEVRVEEAMTPDPFTATPETSLVKVAEEMAEHKYGSAVVVSRGKVVGVFTTVDALRALIDVASRKEKR